jgi:hypothetical protein
VNFSNDGSSLVRHFGIPIPPGGGFVHLLWAPAGTFSAPPMQGTSLTSWLCANPGWSALFSITPIGPVDGRFLGGAVTVPTAVPGAQIEARVAAWRGNFSCFDAASLGAGHPGISQPFTIATGNPLTTPPGLPASITGPNGFKGLNLDVPEPSASVLAFLGLIAVVLRGRFISCAQRR